MTNDFSYIYDLYKRFKTKTSLPIDVEAFTSLSYKDFDVYYRLSYETSDLILHSVDLTGTELMTIFDELSSKTSDKEILEALQDRFFWPTTKVKSRSTSKIEEIS